MRDNTMTKIKLKKGQKHNGEQQNCLLHVL